MVSLQIEFIWGIPVMPTKCFSTFSMFYLGNITVDMFVIYEIHFRDN